MKMELKNKTAISLIVLVITIIVLSILAATVIVSLSNTNIISQASDAVKKTEEQQLEEAKGLMYADGVLGNNPEDMVIGDYTLVWDDEKKEVVQKLGEYVIKEGAIIPTNFYYVGGTKNTGLVISDNSADENKGVSYTCVGNQFVWIPVDDYSKFVRGTAEETSENSGVYKMTGVLSSSYTEPDVGGYETEQSEYDEMCASVEKYGGFYIARFEAGDADATVPRSSSSEVSTVVSKKDKYVCDFVVWDDAVEVSKDMYKDSSSVKSTLCYGVQWDSMLNFVSDLEHDITNPSSWGNNSQSMQKTGQSETWKAKNIYDLAGNAKEYTMESGPAYGCCLWDVPDGCHSVPQRVWRDGDGREYYTLYAGSHSAPGQCGIAFRVTLYLK